MNAVSFWDKVLWFNKKNIKHFDGTKGYTSYDLKNTNVIVKLMLLPVNSFFQQDNPSKHIAVKTKDRFQMRKITILQWPSQLLDPLKICGRSLNFNFTSVIAKSSVILKWFIKRVRENW